MAKAPSVADMSAAHVGDCPTMTFTSQVDGPPIINQPWERFIVIADELLPYLTIHGCLTFEMANGWAKYRMVGRCPEPQGRTVWELVEGLFEPAPATET